MQGIAMSAPAAAKAPLVVILTQRDKTELQPLADHGFAFKRATGPEDALDLLNRPNPHRALVIDTSFDPRKVDTLRRFLRRRPQPVKILLVSERRPTPPLVFDIQRDLRCTVCASGFEIPALAAELREALGLAA